MLIYHFVQLTLILLWFIFLITFARQTIKHVRLHGDKRDSSTMATFLFLGLS